MSSTESKTPAKATATAASADGGDGFDVVTADAVGVTVTEETPAEADKTSNPVGNDAKLEDPPVRTAGPQTPIAQVLGAGAGAHEPTEDPHIGADGRWYADEEAAAATHAEGWGK